MINDQNRVYDGVISFAGGQDSGRNSVLIDAEQYEQGENVHCRGGDLSTRTSFRKLTLNFTNNVTYDENGGHGGANPVGSQAAFTAGLFQGALFYDPSLEIDTIVASIAGRIFSLVPRQTTVDITELSLPTQNRGDIDIAYFVQAERFLVIQDGENSPIIFDGVNIRRAIPPNEIFTGKQMAYGLGRIVLIGKNGRDVYFGDLFGSHEGEPAASVLQFTETNFLSEGGAASLPFTMGHCKGLAFIPEQDTTMGQGELFIFAEKGAASFFLDLPREQWKTSKFQSLALIDIGATGHRSITPVNGDMWFRAKDGWRTYRQARAEANGWFQLPLSTEVSNVVDVETPVLLEFESSINFENRLWTLCTPVPNEGRPYFNGMLSLDFDVLASFGQAAHKPSWDGHHSGIKATQLVTGNFSGKDRAFAFGLDDNNLNCFYELDPTETRDSSGLITSWVIPKSFTFDQFFNESDLLDADTWWREVTETTNWSSYYKPDDYPDFIPWRTGTVYPPTPIAPIGTPTAFFNGMPTSKIGFSPRTSITKPSRQYDQNTKRELTRGYEFHIKLQFTGNASINRFRFHSEQELEKSKATKT